MHPLGQERSNGCFTGHKNIFNKLLQSLNSLLCRVCSNCSMFSFLLFLYCPNHYCIFPPLHLSGSRPSLSLVKLPAILRLRFCFPLQELEEWDKKNEINNWLTHSAKRFCGIFGLERLRCVIDITWVCDEKIRDASTWSVHWWMDRWTDARTERQADALTDGRTHGWTDAQRNDRTDGWMDE